MQSNANAAPTAKICEQNYITGKFRTQKFYDEIMLFASLWQDPDHLDPVANEPDTVNNRLDSKQ